MFVALLYRPPPSNPAHTHHPLSHLRSLAHASARSAHPRAPAYGAADEDINKLVGRGGLYTWALQQLVEAFKELINFN